MPDAAQQCVRAKRSLLENAFTEFVKRQVLVSNQSVFFFF